jgi:hypothetical protein
MASNQHFRTILDIIKTDIKSQLVHLCNERNIIGSIHLHFESDILANNLTGPGTIKVIEFDHTKECLYVDLNNGNDDYKPELTCVEYDYKDCSCEQLVEILTAIELNLNIN